MNLIRMRRTLCLIACLIPLYVAAEAPAPGGVAAHIAELEAGFNESYGANDLPRYFAYYADDVVLLFPEGRTDLASYRKMWTELVDGGTVLAGVHLSDMVIRVSPAGDEATASYAIRVDTRTPDQKISVDHFVETDIWLQRQGQWKVAHVHYSAAPPAR
jgi:ketosteroid isomerase-like protein